MSFALIVTVCTALAGGTDKCDEYVTDSGFPTIEDCVVAMDLVAPVTAPDRFSGCRWLDDSDLPALRLEDEQ